MFKELNKIVETVGGRARACALCGVPRQNLEYWLKSGVPASAYIDASHPVLYLCAAANRRGSGITKTALLRASVEYREVLKNGRSD